ncbi:MAG: phosphatidate cytidylyltransferase [Methylophilaceae bacterium]
MLLTRILTAVVLVAAFIPALFLSSNMVWAISMLIISLLALYEWAKLIGMTQAVAVAYILFCGALGVAMLYLMEVNGFHWLFYQSLLVFVIALIFWMFIVPVLLTKFIVIQNKWLLLFLGILLMAPLWLALISVKGADPWLLLALLATIWIADTAAYFTGKNFGKRKLAPSISPGKTWEGVIGALLAVSVFGGMLYFSGAVSSVAIFPLLWLVAILGVVGDLFESLIKRQANKKDSGNLLPGHGGILDRIDGLMPSLPIAVLMIYLFNYYQVVS